MVEANPKYDDEIDLIELFLTLWAGKWIIVGFTAMSLALAGIYLTLVQPKYASRITIKQNIVPSFPASAIEDLIDGFYSTLMYDEWVKESNDKYLTSIGKFSQLKSKGKTEAELVINSGDPRVIHTYVQYLAFINRYLTQDYQTLSKEELIFLKEQSEVFGSYSEHVLNLLLKTNRFIKNVEKGELVLELKTPTQPVKVSPRTELIFALSVVLGGFLGCSSVLLINLLRRRKLITTKTTSLAP